MSKKQNQQATDYVPCCGKDDCYDCPAAATPGTHTVVDGDSWASIAEVYKTGGSTYAFALRLIELNGGPTLQPGTEIKVNPDA